MKEDRHKRYNRYNSIYTFCKGKNTGTEEDRLLVAGVGEEADYKANF